MAHLSGATPTGTVHLVGQLLTMTGDVDRAAVRAATALLHPTAALTGVTVVDLTRAVHLCPDALHLLLRCLQAAQQRHPVVRLRLHGTNQHTRDQLELLGVLPLLDLQQDP